MGYLAATIGRVFIVRWRGFELGDLAHVRREIAEARTVVGKPLVYLSLIPGDSRTFSAEERGTLLAFVTDIFPDCESVHHVIDGEGFMSSARRSIVTNLAIRTPHPGAFSTYATLEEAIDAIAPIVGIPQDELTRQALARNVAFRRRSASHPPG